MTNKYGILLVSHVEEITDGLLKLLKQVAGDVSIKTAGGTDDGKIGTNFEKISQVLNTFEEETILAFYDLGSAKMNLEMDKEYSDKEIKLYETVFIEGAYVAAYLLQTDVDLEVIEEQLKPLVIKE